MTPAELLLNRLSETSQHFNDEYSVNGAVGLTVDTIWQVDCVDYVAVLLGDNELGPFRYVGMRGVENPAEFLRQTCPMPLWGTLARALVQRPAEGEPDYLIVDNIAVEGIPTREEFPWIPASGCLMILPMRTHARTIGAVILGSRQAEQLQNDSVRRYLCAVAGRAARTVEDARQREEAQQWLQQMVSLHVLTGQLNAPSITLDAIAQTVRSEIADMMDGAEALVFLRDGLHQGVGASDNPTFAGFTHFPSTVPLSDADQMLTACRPEILKWVFQAEEPLFFDPTADTADTSELYYRDSGPALVIPISGNGNGPLGVLLLATPHGHRSFDENDLIVLRSMANCISSALSGHFGQLQRVQEPHSVEATFSLVEPATGPD